MIKNEPREGAIDVAQAKIIRVALAKIGAETLDRDGSYWPTSSSITY